MAPAMAICGFGATRVGDDLLNFVLNATGELAQKGAQALQSHQQSQDQQHSDQAALSAVEAADKNAAQAIAASIVARADAKNKNPGKVAAATAAAAAANAALAADDALVVALPASQDEARAQFIAQQLLDATKTLTSSPGDPVAQATVQAWQQLQGHAAGATLAPSGGGGALANASAAVSGWSTTKKLAAGAAGLAGAVLMAVVIKKVL